MRSFFPVFAILIYIVKASAGETNSMAPMKIGTLDATNYYDQTMIVTGKVVQVTIRPSVTFLNLDRPFPDSPFAIVIIHGKSSYYGDANALKGKSIEITGKIKNYKDKPEIVLSSTNQLTVLDSTSTASHLVPSPKSSPEVVPPVRPAATNFPEIF